jgi:hypothetical protein
MNEGYQEIRGSACRLPDYQNIRLLGFINLISWYPYNHDLIT